MTSPAQQLELFPHSFPGKKAPVKRVNIVNLKIVREATILCPDGSIRSPRDAAKLLQPFLQDADRGISSLSKQTTLYYNGWQLQKNLLPTILEF